MARVCRCGHDRDQGRAHLDASAMFVMWASRDQFEEAVRAAEACAGGGGDVVGAAEPVQADRDVVRVALTCADIPVRAVAASSPNVTSRTRPGRARPNTGAARTAHCAAHPATGAAGVDKRLVAVPPTATLTCYGVAPLPPMASALTL